MTMTNGFVELSNDEMTTVDGGDFWRNLGYGAATVCCVGAYVLTGPIGCAATGAAALWYWYDATR